MVINWHIINIKDCWTIAWVMPIFFFIMGFFYKYEPSFRNLIIKKFKTLLIPMILWSIPMFVYDAFSLPPSDLLFLVVHPFKSVYSVSCFLICTFFLLCFSILMVSIILYRVCPISSLLNSSGKHSLLLLIVHSYIKNILSLVKDKDILIFL